MATGDVIAGQDDVTGSKVLRDVLRDHREELVQSLDTSTLFLTYLAKHHIIEPGDILKYEHFQEKQQRNSDLLDKVIDREPLVDDCYSKFIDALKRSEQDHLAAMLTNVDKELDIVNKYQDVLEKNLAEINGYLQKESRRTELRYSTESPDVDYQRSPRVAGQEGPTNRLTELLQKVHHTTKSTIIHLSRCREVIDKLHSDCQMVAMKNSDLLSKLRECDTLIRHTAPIQAVKEYEQKQDDRLEIGSTVSGRGGGASPWTRSRQNEAATLLDSIRHNVGAIIDDGLDRQREEQELVRVIRNMISDVRARRLVLDRYTEAPPRDLNRNKYAETSAADGDDQKPKPKTKVKLPVYELADELQVYVHQESQLTHKQAIGKLQTSSNISHRNFDQIEHDLMHLEKEVRRGDYAAANQLLKQIAEATKLEREDCLRLTEEMSREVRIRRLKLQEIASGSRQKRRVTGRRRPAKILDSSFLKKLANVQQEVRSYLDLETEVMAKQREEVAKRRADYEKEIRSRMTEVRSLEKRTRDLENEKEKYKKLYAHEKAVKETKLLTKAIIPKRLLTGETEDKFETSIQKPSSRRSFSSTRQYNYSSRRHPDLNASYPKTLSYKPQPASGKPSKNGHHVVNREHSLDRVYRGRSNRQAAAPARHHHAKGSFVAAKPRLTAQAKHLTKLKASVKDRQVTKPPGATRFSYTVRNI